MDQKQIGLFLKELRKQKGITQGQLAEQLNVSDRTVSRWENGNNMMLGSKGLLPPTMLTWLLAHV